MKVRLLYLAIAAMLLAPSFMALAQEGGLEDPLTPFQKRDPIYIGPIFGYNRAMHSVTLKTFASTGQQNIATCPSFENGKDNGFYAGLSYEHHLGKDAASSKSSIIARVMYSTMPSYLESDGDNYLQNVDIIDKDGKTIIGHDVLSSTTFHTMNVKYDMITAEVAYKINPFDGMNLGFTVGPTFDFTMKKTYDQKMELLRPLEARFQRPEDWKDNDAASQAKYGIQRYENGDRTIIVHEGDLPNASSFRFGIRLGVQYEIANMISKTVIVPAAYYNFGITNLSSKEDWRVNALQIGVDVRFALLGTGN